MAGISESDSTVLTTAVLDMVFGSLVRSMMLERTILPAPVSQWILQTDSDTTYLSASSNTTEI